jgi:predicted MPP superfamily phosphohydrolase
VRAGLVVPAAVGLAGAGAVGYAWGVERKSFRLRRLDVPILPAGADPLTVLHISDLHATPGQPWKVEWVRSLAALEPDLVVDTGDNLASLEGIPVALDALQPLLERPGAFVPGSNDWFAPKPKNFARYLLPDDGKRVHGQPLPWGELRTAFTDAGWLDLTHRRTTVTVKGLAVELAGVSDAHLQADHYDRVAGPVTTADVGLGLSHTPEPRVIDAFTADGFGLVLSGHTHGGQLRVPFVGALVTNCGLDRRRARGLWPWPDDNMPPVRTWLHVSAGLGTSPYAPVRFACPPEASLLRLVAADEGIGR